MEKGKLMRVLTTAGVLGLAFMASVLFKGKFAEKEAVAEELPEKTLTAMDSMLFEFERYVSAKIDSAGSVGAAIAIVYQGEIVMVRCFGEREKASGLPVDPHTIFRLASVSKPVTGVLAGILNHEGEIPFDSHVVDYLPGFHLKDSINTYGLKVEHILSHTTGLIPHAYDNLVEAGVGFSTIMDSLYRVNINGAPGKLYSYQNVAFSLYDTLAVAATGKKFGELMENKVFGPLGMTDASVGWQAFQSSSNKALPHTLSGSLYPVRPGNERYFITQPAAGVNASISDLSAFMLAVLGHDSQDLSKEVVNEILRPRVVSPLQWSYLRKWEDVKSKEYAIGWRIIGAYDTRIAYHGGYVRGYRAEMAVWPEADAGIAFLSNSPDGVGSGIVPAFMERMKKIRQNGLAESSQ